MGILGGFGSVIGETINPILGELGGSIFGTPSQTAPSQVAPFQVPYLKDLYSRAKGISMGPALSPLQLQGQQAALQAGQGLSPFIQGAQQAGQFLTSPGLLSPESNPYLARTAQAAISPIFQQLTEQLLPALRSEAIGAGAQGGTRQGVAEGILGRGALQTAGDIASQIFSGGYGQGLGALQAGLQLAPQTAALGLLPSQIMRDIGAERQAAPFEQLARYQSLLGGPIVLGGGAVGRQPGLLESVNIGIGA